MSYPRLGNPNEVNGDFSVEFNWEYKSDENGETKYSITPNKKSFEISNKYFEKLFNEGKIALYWSAFCSKTFLFLENDTFRTIYIKGNNLGGSIELNYYLVAKEDFTLNPPKSEVNSFFDGKTNIKRGTIMSIDDRKELIKPNIVGFGASSTLIKYKLDKGLEKEFRIDFEGADKFIWLHIKNSDFIDHLNKSLRPKHTKTLAINSFFGAILIDAIRQLNNDKEYKWKEDLKELINYEESKRDLYDEFDYAFDIYNTSLIKNEILFYNIMNELERFSG